MAKARRNNHEAEKERNDPQGLGKPWDQRKSRSNLWKTSSFKQEGRSQHMEGFANHRCYRRSGTIP